MQDVYRGTDIEGAQSLVGHSLHCQREERSCRQVDIPWVKMGCLGTPYLRLVEVDRNRCRGRYCKVRRKFVVERKDREQELVQQRVDEGIDVGKVVVVEKVEVVVLDLDRGIYSSHGSYQILL